MFITFYIKLTNDIACYTAINTNQNCDNSMSDAKAHKHTVLVSLLLLAARFSGIYDVATRSFVPQLDSELVALVDNVAHTQLSMAARVARAPQEHVLTDLTWALRVLGTVGRVGMARGAAISNITQHMLQFPNMYRTGVDPSHGISQGVCRRGFQHPPPPPPLPTPFLFAARLQHRHIVPPPTLPPTRPPPLPPPPPPPPPHMLPQPPPPPSMCCLSCRIAGVPIVGACTRANATVYAQLHGHTASMAMPIGLLPQLDCASATNQRWVLVSIVWQQCKWCANTNQRWVLVIIVWQQCK